MCPERFFGDGWHLELYERFRNGKKTFSSIDYLVNYARVTSDDGWNFKLCERFRNGEMISSSTEYFVNYGCVAFNVHGTTQ